MRLLGQTVLALAIFGSVKAQNQDNCHTYAAGACRDTSDHWSAQGSSCNAVYGNIAGNKHNLGKLMADNLKQSFQFIAMVNHYLSRCLTNSLFLILRHLVLQPNLDKTWSLCDIIFVT